ncbi:MAG: Ig-like domain-containing protein, partial [Propionibacteriaceae bacterium]|nr:Ig-like domain-containing protein [Propionibacteriaceae bacterium]
MRRFVLPGLVCGLTLTLISFQVVQAAPPSASLINLTLAGTLDERGGVDGWAQQNAAGLAALGLDPDAVGNASTPAGHNHITNSINGQTATVAVNPCCLDLSVGTVLGTATGTETLTASQGQFAFDNTASLGLITASDITTLFPRISFTVATYTKSSYFSNKVLRYWGHYTYDFRTGQIMRDDKNDKSGSFMTPTGSQVSLAFWHDPLNMVDNSSSVDNGISQSSLLSEIPQMGQGIQTLATTKVNQAVAGFLVDRANQTTWTVGTAAVPYSFGYATSGLTPGQQVTLGLDQVVSQSAWMNDLQGVAQQAVAASFQDVAWEQAFGSSLAATANSSVQDAFDQAFGSGLTYAQLAQAINSRSDAQLVADLADATQAVLDAAAILLPQYSTYNRYAVPTNMSTLLADFELDPLYGDRVFPKSARDLYSEQPAWPMYKYAPDYINQQLVKLVRTRVAANAAWQQPVTEHLSGTVKLTKTFAPGTIRHLVATAITSATALEPLADIALNRSQTTTIVPSLVHLPSGSGVTYEYSSANPQVATVDDAGMVTAVDPGSTTITVTVTVSCAGEAPTSFKQTAKVTVALGRQGVLTVSDGASRPVGTQAANTFTANVTAYDGIGSANDGRGSALVGQTINFSLENAAVGQPTLSAASCLTDANGACSVSVSSTKAGSFILHAQMTDDARTIELASPTTLTWTAGPVDPARSNLTVAALTAGQAGTATVTLRDSHDNPITGLSLIGLALSGADLTIGPDFQESAGVYSVALQSTQAGQHNLTASPGGVVLSATATVGPAPAAQLTLTAEPASAAIGTTVELIVSARDSFANQAHLDAADLSLAADGLTILSGPTATDGNNLWTVTSSAVRTAQPQVTAGGLEAGTSIVFLPGPPSAISLGFDPASAVVGPVGTLGAVATVTVADAAGNPLTGLTSADFSWTFSRRLAASGQDETTDAVKLAGFANRGDGSYNWSVSSTVAGAYQGTVLVRGTADQADGHRATIRFEAGTPTRASLAVDPARGPINQPVTASLSLNDYHGNGVVLSPETIAAAFSSQPANLAAGSWTALQDAYGQPTGVYQAQLTGASPGSYSLQFDWSGVTAEASLTLTQSIGQVQLGLAPLSAPVSTANEASVTATVTVSGDGSPVTGLTADDLTWAATLEGQSSTAIQTVANSFRETSPGVYEIKLHSTTAGRFSFVVGAGGRLSDAAGLTFTPGAPQAGQSSLSLRPTTVALPENGSPGTASASLSLRDRFGNPIPGQSAGLSLTASGSGTLAQSGPTDDSGTYTWQLSTATQGVYEVVVQPDGLEAFSGQVTFKGLIISKANSTVAVSPTTGATGLAADATIWATVTVQDSAGEPIADLTAGDFSLTSTPEGLALDPASFSATDPGVYRFSLWSTRPGTYSATVQVVGVSLDDPADRATVTVEAVPRVARVTVVKAEAMANGADRASATVTVSDGFDNPVAGVTVASAGDELTVQPIQPTDADGATTIAYSTTVIGQHSAQVTLPQANQVAVVGSPVELTFGAACLPGVDPDCAARAGTELLPHLEILSDHALADGQAVDRLRVVVADQLGRPTANVQLRANLDGLAWQTGASGADGQAEFSFASTAAGAHTVKVEAYSQGAWRELKLAAGDPTPPADWLGSPATLVFDPPPANPELSEVIVTPDGQVTVGDVYSATATLRDDSGQPLAGATASFAAAEASLSAETCQTDAQGICAIQLASDQPLDSQLLVTVSVYGADLPITGSPTDLSWAPIPFQTAQPAISTPLPQAWVATAELTVAGTGLPGASLTVSLDQAPVCVVTVAADDGWTCQLTGLAEGGHSLSAVQLSPEAGALPSAEAVVGFNVDTIPPDPPVITQPADGALTAAAAPTLVGTAAEAVTVEVTDETGQSVLTATVLDGAWSGQTSPLADGPHSLSAIAWDAARNQSAATVIALTVKTSASSSLTSPTEGQFDLPSNVTFQGTADAGATVTVTSDGQTLCQIQADEAGAWSCQSSPLADGQHSVVLSAVDLAGNQARPITRTFIVGPPPLAAPGFLQPADGATVTQVRPPLSGDGAEDGAVVTVTADDQALCQAQADAAGAWACVPERDLSQGNHRLSVVQTREGRSSPATEITITVARPAGPTVTVTSISQIIGSGRARFGGQATSGATVTVTADATVLCSATAAETGGMAAWNCSSADPLNDGTHIVTVVATDAAGNPGNPLTRTLMIDLTPPAPPQIDSPTAGETLLDTSVVFTGTAEPGSIVTLSTAQQGALCSVGAPEGDWSCSVVGLPEGWLTILATAADDWDNQSSPTSATYLVDAQPPATPVVTTPEPNAKLSTNQLTISGLGESGAMVRVTASVDDPPPTPDYWTCQAEVDVNGAWSCALDNDLPWGDVTLTAAQTDSHGRTSAVTSIIISLSQQPTEPPAEPSITTSSFNQRVSRGETFSWVVEVDPGDAEQLDHFTASLGDGVPLPAWITAELSSDGWSMTLTASPQSDTPLGTTSVLVDIGSDEMYYTINVTRATTTTPTPAGPTSSATPAASPSPTPSAPDTSPEPSASPEASPTPTPSAPDTSPSPAVSPTPSDDSSPTPSASPRPTDSGTSPTPSAPDTSPTPSASPSPTPSAPDTSPTPSPTPSGPGSSLTPSARPTPSPPDPSPTPTPTPTPPASTHPPAAPPTPATPPPP